MVKARKIRKRVETVRNIRTVARTMEMVATARFRKAHRQVGAARPYTDRLTDLVGDLMERGAMEELDHPLLHEPEDIRRDVMIVLTGDRGLCGGYTTSILQLAMERYEQLVEAEYKVALHVSGKRGVQWLRFRNFEIEKVYTGFGYLPEYRAIGEVAEQIMEQFIDGQISGLEVAYMQYVSASRQRPAISQILPMSYIEPPERSAPIPGTTMKYELLPGGAEILRNLLPATVRLRLWQCFLDAGISEQLMRIHAMRNATENADDMIRELTRTYNRARQAQITSELTDIMGGRMGLE
ncbi:MAG: ATP synthase F1 subunit gamma [Planctomycetota bacterium]|jgi:F-type H+-transporting ATPase subunit gamma